MEDEDNFIKGIFYYEIFFLKYNIYMFSKYNPKSIFFLYGGSTNIINRLQIDINNLNNPLATLTNRRNNYEAALNRVHLILQNKPPHLNVDQLTQNILQDLDHNFNIRNLVNHLIRPSPEDIINRLQLMINGLEHNINRINLQLYNNHNRLNRLNTFNQTPFAQGLPDEVVGKIMRQTQGGGASLSRTPSATGRQLLRSEYGQLMDIQGIISAHGPHHGGDYVRRLVAGGGSTHPSARDGYRW